MLLALLGALNILNVLDLRFTMFYLQRGATEANPFMASLLDADPRWALLAKVGLVLGVSILIWVGRKYRRALELAVIATTVYIAVLVYHIVAPALLATA